MVFKFEYYLKWLSQALIIYLIRWLWITFSKKIDRCKGIFIGLSKQEINEIKMEGTGLYGSGNKSGKICRFKKKTNALGFQKGL